MRIRPLAALSTAALAALLLAGCSSSGNPDASASPSASVAVDLCSSAAPSGPASEAVTVSGEFGTDSSASFASPLDITSVQRTVITEGTGDPIEEGDYINIALSGYDASTGAKLGSQGYTPGEIGPAPIATGTILSQILGCAAPGTRVVAVTPPSSDASTPGQVFIVDLLSVTPTAAWGESQPPVDGMPSVTLADDGQPTVTIPDTAAPTELQISVLKKGDGPAVAAGDTTLLQYWGVDWDTGESFDSSWSKGQPYSNAGNQYVPGFVSALDGQTVGSQVLVVIPPSLAYGEAGSSDNALAGKTLVFVIDILATQHAATQ